MASVSGQESPVNAIYVMQKCLSRAACLGDAVGHIAFALSVDLP